MISELFQIIDAAYGSVIPAHTRHLLAHMVDGKPMLHTGGGNFTPIINDMDGCWSYMRINGDQVGVPFKLPGEPCKAVKLTLPVRIAAQVERDGCSDIAIRAEAAIRNSRASIEQVTGAFRVEFERIAAKHDGALTEFGPNITLLPKHTLLLIDLSISIEAKEECINACAPVDVTCALIQAATNPKLLACLGDRIDELCDSAPCADGTTTLEGFVISTPPSGGVENVTCDTVIEGYALSGMSEDTHPGSNGAYRELTEAEYDALEFPPAFRDDGYPTYLRGNYLLYKRSGEDTYWALFDLLGGVDIAHQSVANDDPLVGAWVDEEGEESTPVWAGATIADICGGACPDPEPCADATATIKTSYGTTVDTLIIPSGGSDEYVIPDATCETLLNAVFVVHETYGGIYTWNGIAYERGDRLFLFDDSNGRWELQDDMGNPISVIAPGNEFPWDAEWAGMTVTQATVADLGCGTCEDGEAVLKDTAGTVLSTTPIPSGTSVDIEAPDGLVTIKDTAGSELYFVPVKSGDLTVEQVINDTVIQRRDTAGASIGSPISTVAESSVNVTCPDAAYQLKDSAGNNIGSPGIILSNASANITAPDGSVQLKDSAGTNIGSPVAVRSNQTGVTVTAPDGTIKTTDGVTTVGVVKSNGSTNLPQNRIKYKDSANADQFIVASDTEYDSGTNTLNPATQIPRRELKNFGGTGTGQFIDAAMLVADTIPNTAIPLKFAWGAGDSDTLTFTVTTDEAGTYGTYTPSGDTGTLTYSKNGAAFAALSGSITLAVSDTIAVRRTTTTNAGAVKWAA